MDKNEIDRKVREEEDYIRCPKLGNSLVRFMMKNSEGVENPVIARLLAMSEEEVAKIYEESVANLRENMVDSEDEGS